MENFTCRMEGFVKIEICLLHSDFAYSMEKFRESSLQQSNFNAYKILNLSCKNLSKVSGILQKHVKLLCALDKGLIPQLETMNKLVKKKSIISYSILLALNHRMRD